MENESKNLFHRFSSLETAAVLVVFSAFSVVFFGNALKHSSVFAASLSGFSLSMLSGEQVSVACPAGSTLSFQSTSGANTGTVVCTAPTPMPTKAPVTMTLGSMVKGTAGVDTDDSNSLAATMFRSGGAGFSAGTAAVFVGNIDTNVANRKFQVGIYSDAAGKPGTLLGVSSVGTLTTANSWNTVGFSQPVSLAANTDYWLAYNTNGSTASVNNLYFSRGGKGAYANNRVTFGTWTSVFPALTSYDYVFSIYVTSGNSTTSLPLPTMQPTVGAPTSTPGSVMSATDSHAYGLWVPYVNASGQTVDTCTKAQHDAYYVIAPDGKKYPTWHPATGPNGCTFGHEHGQDPSKFANWDRLRRLYAYDQNDLSHAGIPFGYANETLVDWVSLSGSSIVHRHEDHVGHKIHYMNAEPMERYGQFNPATNSTERISTPMKCNLFGKLHMGVTTKDAFTNNLHEFISYENCTDSVNSANNYEVGTVFLAKFGKPGEFLSSCIGGGADEQRDPCGPGLKKLDYFNTSSTYPGSCSDGTRSIVDWNCVQNHALVPEGQFSFNFYEIWNTKLQLLDTNKNPIAMQDGAALEVNDAIRYFDPRIGDYNGHVVDLCKITGTRQMRGLLCDEWRAAGSPAWDSPKSAQKGANRAMYYVPFQLFNAGKSATYCANPFGEQATATSGNCPKGYIKQYVSSKNFDFAKAYGSGSNTENSQDVQQDFDAPGVHAPN